MGWSPRHSDHRGGRNLRGLNRRKARADTFVGRCRREAGRQLSGSLSSHLRLDGRRSATRGKTTEIRRKTSDLFRKIFGILRRMKFVFRRIGAVFRRTKIILRRTRRVLRRIKFILRKTKTVFRKTSDLFQRIKFVLWRTKIVFRRITVVLRKTRAILPFTVRRLAKARGPARAGERFWEVVAGEQLHRAEQGANPVLGGRIA